MKKAINAVWQTVSDHGFVILLSVAAIVHSAWSINSVFSGHEPTPMYSSDWWGWYLPGFLMALTIDVGLIQFIFKLQRGARDRALIVGYLLLCALMAFGQFIYVASHMADIVPSAGVASYDLTLTNALIKAALYVYPLALPVVSAIYAFSVRGQSTPPAIVSTGERDVTVNFIRPEPHHDPALPTPTAPELPALATANSAEEESPIEIVLPTTVNASEQPTEEHSITIRQRRTSDRHCKHCGAPFVSNNPRKLYCSDSCRNLSVRARKSQ